MGRHRGRGLGQDTGREGRARYTVRESDGWVGEAGCLKADPTAPRPRLPVGVNLAPAFPLALALACPQPVAFPEVPFRGAPADELCANGGRGTLRHERTSPGAAASVVPSQSGLYP